MTDQLIAEARALLHRLNAALADCFEEHPHLGEVARPGTALRIRRLKGIRQRAQRRLNCRLHAAGYPVPINRAFAMWIINDVYKPGK